LDFLIEITATFIKRSSAERNVNLTKQEEYTKCFYKTTKLLEMSEDYKSLIKFFELSINFLSLTNLHQSTSGKNVNLLNLEEHFENLFHHSFKPQIVKLFNAEMSKVDGGNEIMAFEEEILFYGKLLSIDFKIDQKSNDSLMGFSMSGLRHFNKNTISLEILNLFRRRLNDLKLDSILELRVKFDFGKLGASVEKLRNEFDNYFTEKFVQESTKSFKFVYNQLKDTKNRLFIVKFAENYLNKSLRVANDNDFSCLLNNDLVLLMFDLNYSDENNRVFNKKYDNLFTTLTHSFIDCIKALITGEIRVSQIRLLKQYKENACKHIKILSKFNIRDSPLNQTDVIHFKNLIEFRNTELGEFVTFRNKIQAFLQFCSNFKDIDLELLQRDHRNLTSINIEEKSLSIFCRPISFNQIQTNFSHECPLVIYFKSITKNKIEQIEKFIQLDRLKCVLFDHLMNESLENCRNDMGVEQLSVDMLLNEVEDEVFRKWSAIANTIDSGRIKLVEIDDYLKKFFSNKEDKLIKEFIYIIEKCQIKRLAQRRNEICLYFRFKSSVEIARMIETIRVNFKMTNSFPELKELLSISSQEFKEWTIEKMDSKVEVVIGILNKMNHNVKISCLKAFNTSIELVEWLRTSLKDIKELKFLIDLASIAKNADSSQAYKKDLLAKVLKESCIAYSPLIFDLKPNDTFTRFVELCDTVWSNLESDKNIAEKLIEATNRLSILKELKEKKGKLFFFVIQNPGSQIVS